MLPPGKNWHSPSKSVNSASDSQRRFSIEHPVRHRQDSAEARPDQAQRKPIEQLQDCRRRVDYIRYTRYTRFDLACARLHDKPPV